METGLEKFFTDEYKQAKAEGRAEGRTEAIVSLLLRLLSRRGLVATAAQQRRLEECTDVATIERWVDLVLSVRSVDELLT